MFESSEWRFGPGTKVGQAVSLPSQPHGACQEVLPQEAGMAVATGRERCGVNWAGQGVG